RDEDERTIIRLIETMSKSAYYLEQELGVGNTAYGLAYAQEHLEKLELHIEEREHVLRCRVNPKTWSRARHRATMYTTVRGECLPLFSSPTRAIN
ncbi:hypothetical protein KEM52_004892, partial [Ascosphaera acerosa]